VQFWLLVLVMLVKGLNWLMMTLGLSGTVARCLWPIASSLNVMMIPVLGAFLGV
jgi:hypothetical protein